ncbi:MAG: hypothetical protein ACREQ3_09775 [Candidatus Binatia bacterium]
MDRQFVQSNAASRQRLHGLIARLDDEAMQRVVHDDWTVSALLAHFAFWDQSCAARWDHFDRTGSFIGLSDETIDIVNAANFPTWRALPGDAARDLALCATEETDARPPLRRCPGLRGEVRSPLAPRPLRTPQRARAAD